MFRLQAILCASLFLLVATPTYALCSGASLQQEFREADVVVRARLMAETNVWDDEPSAAFRAKWGEYSPVRLSRLRTLEVFKGRPGPAINLFQEVTSGRFEVDPDRDYLLFLNYIRPFSARPLAARGAMYVRYACGQSKPMSEVRSRDLAALRRLSRPR